MHPLLAISAATVGLDLVVGAVVLTVGVAIGASGLMASAGTFLAVAVSLGVVTIVLAAGEATPTRMRR